MTTNAPETMAKHEKVLHTQKKKKKKKKFYASGSKNLGKLFLYFKKGSPKIILYILGNGTFAGILRKSVRL